MIAYVYQVKRRRGGRLVRGRIWRARIRFAGEHRLRDVSLGVTGEKRTAEQKLRQILNEHGAEAVGLLPSQRVREASLVPCVQHLAGYQQELTARGRGARHVRNVGACVGVLVRDCGWEHLKDISAESFNQWRQRQQKSGKTLNEYLQAARAFLKWAEGLGYLTAQPLSSVARAQVQGRQARVRRAYSPGEAQRLLAASGKRRVVYLAAMLTGLRRGELGQLRWGDLQLEGPSLTVLVRASISKNHRAARLPLNPDLALALRQHRPATATAADVVFADGLPTTKQLRTDQRTAGIDGADHGGGRLDFHSFRVTYCTQLASVVSTERERMELMRHKSPRLTAEVYTDPAQLVLGAVVGQLNFHRPAGGGTQGDTQTAGQGSPAESTPVQATLGAEGAKSLATTGEKSVPVVVSHHQTTGADTGAQQVANLRYLELPAQLRKSGSSCIGNDLDPLHDPPR